MRANLRRKLIALLLGCCGIVTVTPILADDTTLDPSRWQLVTEKGANAAMETINDAGTTGKAIMVTVNKPGPEFWSVELRAPGVPLQKGKTYELKFRAKSIPGEYVYFVLEKDFGDQGSVAAGTNLAISGEWTDCTLSFQVQEDATPGRLTISSLSVEPSKFWFSDFRFGEKAP